MHRIYIEKRCIVICQPEEQDPRETEAERHELKEDFDPRSLAEKLRQSSPFQKTCLVVEDAEAAYRKICAEFKEVNAGGGLVSNQKGDYLLIRRNGVWDLPKGHKEDGENIEGTAMREVREEIGIPDVILEGLICVTDHCYFRDGTWHLKHTWWYRMLCNAPYSLTPQKEEDISQAVWVEKTNLSEYLSSTYPSIIEVFQQARA